MRTRDGDEMERGYFRRLALNDLRFLRATGRGWQLPRIAVLWLRRDNLQRCDYCARTRCPPWPWWTDDSTYQAVEGNLGGTPCARCFDRRAARDGIRLRWVATDMDRLTGENR